MTVRLGARFLTTLGAVLVLAACTQTSAGEPVGSSGGASTSPSQQAPPVPDPKDLTAVPDPCRLLTAEQLAELGATGPPETGTSVWGEPSCRWFNEDLVVYLAPDTRRQGLSELYLREDNFAGFEPVEVDGHPAILIDEGSQDCGAALGVADDETLHLSFGRVTGDRPEYRDPCGFAMTIASMVLSNLPPAG